MDNEIVFFTTGENIDSCVHEYFHFFFARHLKFIESQNLKDGKGFGDCRVWLPHFTHETTHVWNYLLLRVVESKPTPSLRAETWLSGDSSEMPAPL